MLNIFSTLSVMLDEAERQMRKAGIDWTNPCKLLSPIERPKKAPRPRDNWHGFAS